MIYIISNASIPDLGGQTDMKKIIPFIIIILLLAEVVRQSDIAGFGTSSAMVTKESLGISITGFDIEPAKMKYEKPTIVVRYQQKGGFPEFEKDGRLYQTVCVRGSLDSARLSVWDGEKYVQLPIILENGYQHYQISENSEQTIAYRSVDNREFEPEPGSRYRFSQKISVFYMDEYHFSDPAELIFSDSVWIDYDFVWEEDHSH